MSQLVKLREQIKSIQTTRRTTHAIKLVSMSLYSRLEKQLAHLMHYAKNIREIFSTLVAATPHWKNPIFLPNDRLDSRPLIIITAPSKGLCGNLNTNLFRYLKQAVTYDSHQTPCFISIGKKAKGFLSDKNNSTIICSYKELNADSYVSIANDLTNRIVTADIPFTSVHLYSTIFKGFFTHIPHKTPLIPLAPKASEYHNSTASFSWEQPTDETLTHLATRYLQSEIMQLLFQALLAEQAARFLAMNSSTMNADKYLEHLTLQHNKLRQSRVTKEVAELLVNLFSPQQ